METDGKWYPVTEVWFDGSPFDVPIKCLPVYSKKKEGKVIEPKPGKPGWADYGDDERIPVFGDESGGWISESQFRELKRLRKLELKEGCVYASKRLLTPVQNLDGETGWKWCSFKRRMARFVRVVCKQGQWFLEDSMGELVPA